MKNILIIGDIADPHIASVTSHLRKSDASIYILNPFDGQNNSITYEYDPFSITIESNGNIISIEKIDSVWWRFKPNLTSYPKDISEFETQQFIQREWQLTLEPLKYFLRNAFWINKRESDLLVRNKPFQLYVAKQHGFKIPRGIISSHVSKIRKHLIGYDKFIYKPLSYFIIPPDKVLYATPMTKKEVEEKRKSIELAPCIFQHYIQKSYELRVTIIGKKVFAAKINSQDSDESKNDWRRDQLNITYEKYELNDSLKVQLLSLHKSFDIFYGAYDFIVDEQNQVFFLEVNPSGQWLWIENKIGLSISKEISNALITTHNK